MILAYRGIIPSKDWIHNKYLKSDENKTIEDYLL